MREQHAFFRHAIEGWSARDSVAVRAGVRPGLIVGDGKQNIRTLVAGPPATGDRDTGRCKHVSQKIPAVPLLTHEDRFPTVLRILRVRSE